MIRPHRGVTLIELLVAIAIFGVLSAVAYRALAVVLESRDRVEQEERKWRELGLLFARLEQDVAAVAPRPIRDANSRIVPAFVGNRASSNGAEGGMLFTRTGFAADAEVVGPPRRVGYRLRGGAIELLAWDALDQGPRAEPLVTALLRNVTSMDLRYLDGRGEWHAAWPSGGQAIDVRTSLPSAVEVAITLASGERIRRLFATAARSAE